MKVLDAKLDNSPTSNDVKELAELRIRNLLCFKELKNLNDNGCFLNAHPILRNAAEYDQLVILWNTNREQFIREYENCKNNIRRYAGRMKSASTNAEKAEDAWQNKQRHEERAIIFKKILTNEPNNSNI